ncbi:DUF1501 domain-containing protein [Mucisphaera sp.]|uniref:DUF1501 domain-containing protein n=1 Tax=Mucisphaera sp. TaxID=2913024 RepID=UPI003D118497
MSEKLPFTRREFLQSSLALMSTLGTMPGFLAHASAAANDPAALLNPASVTEGRVLVVIQLSGGNDGLNTVIPAAMPEYYKLRSGLAVQQRDVLQLDDRSGIGLHPNMRATQEMFQDGQATIIQGVGYPNPNRSHFASMDVWHAGDTRAADGHRGIGWIGKAFDAQQARSRNDDQSLHCITVGEETPMATVGEQAKPVAFSRAELFEWSGKGLHPKLRNTYDRLHNTPIPNPADTMAAMTTPARATGIGGAADFVFRTALDARAAPTQVRKAVSRDSETQFPNSGLSRQLRAVASMIAAELPTRIYYVALGGFDTHANQANTHARLLEQFSQAVQAFYRELAAIGQDQRVLTMAFSEFGRRVDTNGSNGTDHGAAGPLFLFGPPARAGLVGPHPSLQDLDRGDLKFNIDFRSVYATLLDDWLGLDSRAALGKRFRTLPVLDT